MHALAGIISPRGVPALAHPPQRMVDRLCHDSSRVPGYGTFEAIGARVGWVAPPEAAAKPAWSRTRQVAVLLASDATALHSTQSAASLADAIEHSGLHALTSLNGWFSGLIVDLRDCTATLFNDRYGLGRLYYHETPHGFFFSSEAKSLLAVLPQLRQLDPRGVAELFSVGCVLQNRSLFSGIHLLPHGSAWKFHRDGRIDKHRYFDPALWEQQPLLDSVTYGERLREVFARIAARCVGGTSPVAMSLTGGLDSRAVMAWAGVEPGALPCYTFGGPFRDCADVQIARRLAKLCQHPHTTIRIGSEFFSHFQHLAEKSVYLSDGAMDVSGAVELHVNRKAREIAPVRLTGNYGSEILRSHVAFRPGQLDRSLFTPDFNRLIDEAAETYRQETACHRLSFIAFKQVPWHHYARFSVEKSQLTPRSPFLDNELVALAYQAPRELSSSPRPLLHLIAQGNPSLASLGTDRALRTRSFPLVSRAARAWQEFTAKAEYAYDYGMPRWLARTDRALTGLRLEKLFLGRHKFYHFRVWYRDQLREIVHGHGQLTQPAFYREGVARQLTADHVSGRANRTLELHKLLSLQLIDRSLLRA
ncbi:MAG: asparagine synthase-related protein [Verrucomicrobiota bacterium]